MTAPKGSTFSAAYKPSLYEEKIDKSANWHQRLRKLERVFGRRTGNIGCVQLFVAHRRFSTMRPARNLPGHQSVRRRYAPCKWGNSKTVGPFNGKISKKP